MILALDLSTPQGTLAVVEPGGDAIFSATFRAHRSHNALVFTPLKEALATCGNGGPTGVVIGIGPGSYTGVRVAIAAGTGIAMAFEIPLVGWPSAYAAEREGEGQETRFLFVGDARRGRFFGAEVDPKSGGGSFEIELFEVEAFGDWLRNRPGLPVWTFDPTPPVSEAKVTEPNAAQLGRIALGWGAEGMAERDGKAVEPIYLSAPFVTMPKQ